MGMALRGTPRVFCAKSAQIVERNGDDVFSLAKERVERAKERWHWEDWQGWAVKITTNDNIHRALSSRRITPF
jgi:hypothetical protein